MTSIQKQIAAHEDYIRESKPLLEMLANSISVTIDKTVRKTLGSERLIRDIEGSKPTLFEDKASQVSRQHSIEVPFEFF